MNFFFGAPRSQRSISSRGDLEADVVRRAGVARAGVAETDDQPVDRRDAARRAASTAATRSSDGGVAVAGGLGLAVARRLGGLARLADDRGLGLELVELGCSSARRAEVGDDGLARRRRS